MSKYIKEQYKNKPILIQDYVDSLSMLDLKKKFLELWNHFSPKSSKDIIDSDYPYNFWIFKIYEPDEIDALIEEINKYDKSEKFLLSIDLLGFFKESKFYIQILQNWCESYIKFAEIIKDEFRDIGITEEKINFDPFNYFTDDDNYEWDDGYDLIEKADIYFSQFKRIFSEMGKFYEILLTEHQYELAEIMLDKGLKWFLEMRIGEGNYDGLLKLYKIQKRLTNLVYNNKTKEISR